MILLLIALMIVGVTLILFTSSRKVTFVALVLWTISAIWVQPWKWYIARPLADAELEFFRQYLRKQAWWWTGLSILFLIVAMVVFLSKGTRSPSQNNRPTRPERISTATLLQIIFVMLFVFGIVFVVFVAK